MEGLGGWVVDCCILVISPVFLATSSDSLVPLFLNMECVGVAWLPVVACVGSFGEVACGELVTIGK